MWYRTIDENRRETVKARLPADYRPSLIRMATAIRRASSIREVTHGHC